MSTHDEPLNHALEVIREHLQGTQRGLTFLRDANHAYSEQSDQLAALVETIRQQMKSTQDDLVALREVGHICSQRDDELAATTNTLRQEVRETRDDLTALRGIHTTYSQQVSEVVTTLDALRQELQDARQAEGELEKALKAQSVEHREQLDAHTRELAALTEQSRVQAQELREHVNTLTSLHKQEQSRQETALATLGKMADRVGVLEQRFSEEQTRSVEAVETNREQLAALEKWLGAQADQFGRFDPVLRELHGQMIALHERLAVLESVESANVLDDHKQRLGQAERQIQMQAQALEEMQQTLEQFTVRMPAAVRFNKILIGGFIGAGVIIVALLILLGMG